MNFPKILVALDFSTFDKTLIEYSRFIVEKFDANSIKFVHVVPSYILSDSLDSNLKSLLKQDSLIPERYQEKLGKDIQSTFGDLKGVNINISIKAGKPQTELLRLIKENKPDLLVLGKKEISGGSGILAQRIARKAECAVCFITEQVNLDLQKILVPIDFSAHSLRALKTALHLKEQSKEINITALHLIDVPMTAYKINRNKAEIIRRMKESAEQSFRHFLTQNHLSESQLDFKMRLNDDFDVSRYIKKIALSEKSDLIITGAKGRSGLSGFVFGSVTENLISTKDTPSVLVVR